MADGCAREPGMVLLVLGLIAPDFQRPGVVGKCCHGATPDVLKPFVQPRHETHELVAKVRPI
jgi:hypothetical protein